MKRWKFKFVPVKKGPIGQTEKDLNVLGEKGWRETKIVVGGDILMRRRLRKKSKSGKKK